MGNQFNVSRPQVKLSGLKQRKKHYYMFEKVFIFINLLNMY